MNVREALVLSALKESLEAMLKDIDQQFIDDKSIESARRALDLLKQERIAGNIKQEIDWSKVAENLLMRSRHASVDSLNLYDQSKCKTGDRERERLELLSHEASIESKILFALYLALREGIYG